MDDLRGLTPGELLLEAAAATPERVLAEGERRLVALPPDAHFERAVTSRAMSVAARILGSQDRSLEHAGDALTEAMAAGDPDEVVLARLTMVGPLLITGRLGEALTVMDEAEKMARGALLRARCLFQRGVVLDVRGEVAAAIDCYQRALPALRDAGDDVMVRSALQNLGSGLVRTGRLDEAEDALDEALAIAEARDEQPAVSGIRHNLGLLASYRGDIPEALAQLEESDAIYMHLTGAEAPQHVARCEVLMSAGLFLEAHGLADAIAEANRRSGDAEHLGNALVVAAHSAHLAGLWDEAERAATDAIATLTAQGRRVGALEAALTRLETLHSSGGITPAHLDEARSIANELAAQGLLAASGRALLVTGEIALASDDLATAGEMFDQAAGGTGGPVEARVGRLLARSLSGIAKGDRRRALAAARSGLDLVDRYQGALGATDLRSGVERHARRLGGIGLALALDAGRPRMVLDWMERTRARALRHRPVMPPSDSAVADALTRLRRVEAEMRDPDHEAGLSAHALRRNLQEEVRRLDRLKRPEGSVEERPSVADVLTSLGERTLIEIAVHDGRLVAVEAARGRARLHQLGPAAEVLAEVAHIRFAMRRAARLGRGLDEAIFDPLDRLLFAEMARGDGGVVLSPPPALMAAPWAALPSLQGAPLTLAPSAEVWWRAGHRPSLGGDVVVAGGPGLESASWELEAVAALYPGSRLALPGVTAAEVHRLLGTARLAHIASHATFSVENPMFSSLRLADGDLSVYDLERLASVPSLVVLSACDSGYTESRAGDELAGLTSSLLAMGARTVVAGVGLVPDTAATAELMVRFHRGLVDGKEPSVALADAQAELRADPTGAIAAASFVCVGA